MDPIVYYVLIGCLAFLILILLIKALRIVPQKSVLIIERWGKYHGVAEAGLNAIVPFMDSVRQVIDLREQITPIEPQPVITKDNVTIKVNTVTYYVIIDPIKATYEIANLRAALDYSTLAALRNVIGHIDLDAALTSRDTINAHLREALDGVTQPWGVKVIRVELRDIIPPEEIRLTMEKQMTAERSRRAVVTTAEGEKASAILKSEGQRQAQIFNAEGAKESAILAAQAAMQSAVLAAEGQASARLLVAKAEAQAIELISSALQKTVSNPAQYLLAQRYLDSLKDVAANAQKVVFMPMESTAALGAMSSIKEIFGNGK